MNKVILKGNVGHTPEIKEANGRKLAKFTMATNESYRNSDGEKVTETEWHNLVAFEPIAQVIDQYVTKGTELLIEGKIKTRSYDDRDGNKKYFTEIIVRAFEFCGSKRDGDQDQAPREQKAQPSAYETVSDREPNPGDNAYADDLPF